MPRKGRRKGNRPQKDFKDRRRVSKSDEDFRGHREAENDVSWYSKYPNLLVAAGSFPYPYRPGMEIDLGPTTAFFDNTFVAGEAKVKIPGVLALEWLPSIGRSNTPTDPASVMAKEIYARVRKAYSGSLSVDAPDFVIYLLALDSIFSYIAGLKRIYRILNAWSPDNYVLPDVLLGALGITASDIQILRAERVELWQAINTLVLQSRKFTCPAVMDYFNRHYWMNDNVYTDAQSINSQFYVFQMNGVYKYASLPMPNGDEAGGLQMIPTPWNWNTRTGPNDKLSVWKLLQFGVDLINALVAWDEAYEINGYLSRAFEGTPNFIVDELPLEQPFNPVYSEEVLVQIENSRTLPACGSLGVITDAQYKGFNITQNVLDNSIISNPQYEYTIDDYWEIQGNGWKLAPTISARSDQPTVADNVIATRLQSYATNVLDKTVLVQCASEVALAWWYYDHNGDPMPRMGQYVPQNSVAVYKFDNKDGTVTKTSNGVGDLMPWILDLGMFDWHPFLYTITASIALNSGVVSNTEWHTRVFGDVHNITVLREVDIKNLHTICLYSELNSFSV